VDDRTSEPGPRWLSILQGVLLVVGLAAFVWLVAAAGPAALWLQARRLGLAGAGAIVLLGGVELALHALAWRQCCPRGARPAPGGALVAHLAGNALSLVTPTATAGGELLLGTGGLLLLHQDRGNALLEYLYTGHAHTVITFWLPPTGSGTTGRRRLSPARHPGTPAENG